MKTTARLNNSVFNRKRKVSFGCLVANGWFSAAPDDDSVNRAIRTNNPGALDFTDWQHNRQGYVGKTLPDSAGNETTIYQTPEHGIAAWYFLLRDIYGFDTTGAFDLQTLAKKYAGADATSVQIKSYLDGWNKWSNGTLHPDTVIHLLDNSEMMSLAKALFAHEAGAFSPLCEAQIMYGFDIERKRRVRRRSTRNRGLVA
jgi:D-alanyl-D-alanine carboxypeptidase